MSVWLTFILSVFAAVGMFLGVYLALELYIGSKKRGAKPTLGLYPLENGALGVWVKWKPTVYVVKIYRILISYYSPEHADREGKFSVTFSPPQGDSFAQPIELPERFKAIIESDGRAIITVGAKTTEELLIEKTVRLRNFRKLMKGSKKVASGVKTLELAKEDEPVTATLDFEELTDRKKKVDKLVVAAKAKEAAVAKAAAAKAAKAAGTAKKPAEVAPAEDKAPTESPPEKGSPIKKEAKT